MNYTIECEQKVDGRWLAEFIELPGVLAYEVKKTKTSLQSKPLPCVSMLNLNPSQKRRKLVRHLLPVAWKMCVVAKFPWFLEMKR